MKTWLKWTIGIFAYLVIGYIVLSLLLRLFYPCKGMECLGLVLFLFVYGYPVWMGIGAISILSFSKIEYSWLKGMLWGITASGILAPLIAFGIIPLQGIIIYLTGFIPLTLGGIIIGALIGFIIGKAKKK